MRIGYHAPMPPAPTGVADYAQALLKALQPGMDVVRDATEADLHLYQLGNNQLHHAIHARAMRVPGVVLLHDANLHHYYLGSLAREAYVREFCAQYGDWHQAFAERLWQERAASSSDARYFHYAMLGGVARNSRAIFVHNRAAAAIVDLHRPSCPVWEIPHLAFSPPEIPYFAIAETRRLLNVSPHEYLLGVFGHLRESKRLGAILRAFHRASRRSPSLRLLIAGEFLSKPHAESLDALMQHGKIVRTGFLPEQEFWTHAHAVDACINLRYPSCGESSGIAIRLMSASKPVFLTEGLEHSAFPSSSYIPISSGLAEEEEIEEWMALLGSAPDIGKAIGERAAEHVARQHSAGQVSKTIRERLALLKLK